MKREPVALLFLPLLIVCGFELRVAAQQYSCIYQGQSFPTDKCGHTWQYVSGDPAPPYGSVCYCGESFNFMTTCWIKTDQCSATCPTCHEKGGQPINLATGNTFISETDLTLPGLGGGLELTRTWNSIVPFGAQTIGMFGQNWISTFEEQVFIGSDNLVKYSDSSGDLWTFGLTSVWGGPNNASTYSLVAPRNGGASLSYDGNYLTITLKNGEKRVFSVALGQLLSISDRNGNTTQLSYNSSNRLTTVTDPASRHLYFNYGPGSNLVASVTSDFGVSLSYTYSGLYLVQVTRPDNTFITFDYSALPGMGYLITAVKDQNGKILESHTYDTANRGLSSQRANGVDSLSIDYLQ